MDKFYINRNRKPLTPDDVQKGKNFDAFMKAYSARPKPFWGSTKMYLSIATVGIVATVATWMVVNNSSTNPTDDSKTAFVVPKLDAPQMSDTTFVVDAANGANFIYKTGSFIHIPQHAFVDENGKPVSGSVEIHYREFHTDSSIINAGIPVTYDSAGRSSVYVSNGMLVMSAWQNGHELAMNSSNQVKVAMAIDAVMSGMGIYFLDTLAKKWSFVTNNNSFVAGFTIDSTKSNVAANNAALPALPIQPKKADKNKHSFVIAFEPSEFPELSVYKGVRFEVDETKTPYNKMDRNVSWEDVKIARNADRKSYTVTFTAGTTTSTYVTGVVVDEINYAAAMKVYDQKYAAYQAALKESENNTLVSNRTMNADAAGIFGSDSLLDAAIAAHQKLSGSDKLVMYQVTLNNFGVWSAGQPVNYE